MRSGQEQQGTLTLDGGPERVVLREQSALRSVASVPVPTRPAMLALPACLGWLASSDGDFGANEQSGPCCCRPRRSW